MASNSDTTTVCDRVHIFTFVKNEAFLMRDWIPYHASLVGFANIHIIDHSSTDESDTLYEKYQPRGLSVVKTALPFTRKSRVLSKLMQRYKESADFLIPLDGDEFLCARAVNTDGEDDNRVILVASPFKVRHELRCLPCDGRKLMLNQFLLVNDCKDYNDPLLEARRFTFTSGKEITGPFNKTIVKPNSGKAFYPAPTFLWTDQGNHFGCVSNENDNPGFHSTSLCTAHFSVYGLTQFSQKLEKGIAAYGLDNKSDDYDGCGNHWFRWMVKVRESDIETVFCREWVHPKKGSVQPALATRIEQVRKECLQNEENEQLGKDNDRNANNK